MTYCTTCAGSTAVVSDDEGLIYKAVLKFDSPTHGDDAGEWKVCPKCGREWATKRYKRYEEVV